MMNFEWTSTVGLAFAIYMASHLLRSLRFWLVYNDVKLSLKQTFGIFYSTAVLGYWIPAFISESLRVLVFWKLRGEFFRSLLSVGLVRALDLICIGALILISTSQSQLMVGILIGSLGFLILTFVLGYQRITLPVKNALIARFSGQWVIPVLRAVEGFRNACKTISLDTSRLLGFGFLLTVCIWMLDAWAFRVILAPTIGSVAFIEQVSEWLNLSLGGLLGSAMGEQGNWNVLRQLFVPQTLGLIFMMAGALLFSCVHFLKFKRSRVVI